MIIKQTTQQQVQHKQPWSTTVTELTSPVNKANPHSTTTIHRHHRHSPAALIHQPRLLTNPQPCATKPDQRPGGGGGGGLTHTIIQAGRQAGSSNPASFLTKPLPYRHSLHCSRGHRINPYQNNTKLTKQYSSRQHRSTPNQYLSDTSTARQHQPKQYQTGTQAEEDQSIPKQNQAGTLAEEDQSTPNQERALKSRGLLRPRPYK